MSNLIRPLPLLCDAVPVPPIRPLQWDSQPPPFIQRNDAARPIARGRLQTCRQCHLERRRTPPREFGLQGCCDNRNTGAGLRTTEVYDTYGTALIAGIVPPNAEIAMKFTFIAIIAIFLLVIPKGAWANELIARNVLNAREDMHLITSSIEKTSREGDFFAIWFMQPEKPNDRLEIFDGNFNVIGHEIIGIFRSYAYGTVFDCNERLKITIWTQYFSTPVPSKGNVLKTEKEDAQTAKFLPVFGAEEKLLDRVCFLGGFKR